MRVGEARLWSFRLLVIIAVAYKNRPNDGYDPCRQIDRRYVGFIEGDKLRFAGIGKSNFEKIASAEIMHREDFAYGLAIGSYRSEPNKVGMIKFVVSGSGQHIAGDAKLRSAQLFGGGAIDAP